MPIVQNWTSYGLGAAYLTKEKAKKAIEIMRQTAVQHSLELNAGMADLIKYKVNNSEPPSGTDLPSAPLDGEYNWMRITIGIDGMNNEIAVIVYHLLRHRLVDKKTNAYWSSSAGFLLNLVPNPPNAAGGASDAKYIELANDFADQMNKDLKSFKPSGKYSVVYDHVDKTEASGDAPGEKEAHRRSTKVGELGWAFQHDTGVKAKFAISKPVKVNRPVDKKGKEIPGWGRDSGLNGSHDDKIVVTVLEALP